MLTEATVDAILILLNGFFGGCYVVLCVLAWIAVDVMWINWLAWLKR